MSRNYGEKQAFDPPRTNRIVGRNDQPILAKQDAEAPQRNGEGRAIPYRTVPYRTNNSRGNAERKSSSKTNQSTRLLPSTHSSDNK